jgi:sulfatase maturation enzyme AslB (radical SAM superfamily)
MNTYTDNVICVCKYKDRCNYARQTIQSIFPEIFCSFFANFEYESKIIVEPCQVCGSAVVARHEGDIVTCDNTKCEEIVKRRSNGLH